MLTLQVMCLPQSVIVSGYVSDKASGETLPSANIFSSGGNFGTTTNQFGYYSIVIQKSACELTASFAGYQAETIRFLALKDTLINISLDFITLSGVEIISSEQESPDKRIGRISMPISKMKQLPGFMGEPDVLKALSILPGVSNGSEGTSGLYIRGGSSDQNLILLDGATVYNSAHLFGFLSIFNTDAIKSVELFKGDFPARFGGRLSSVVDITTKDGNSWEHQQSLSVSPLSSHFTVEGPFRKYVSSYLVSGRFSYLGLFMLPAKISFQKGEIQNYMNYWMYDMNMKYNHQFNTRNRLYLSAYIGNDKLINKQKEEGRILNYPLNWGNITFSTRYTHIFNKGLFSSSHFNINSYHFRFRFLEESGQEKILCPVQVDMESSVRDVALKHEFSWTPVPVHTFKSGIEAVYQTFIPDFVRIENIPGFSDSLLSEKNNHIPIRSLAIYIQDHLTLKQRYMVDVGLRLPLYHLKEKKYFYFEPRLNLTYQFQRQISAKLSFARMSQPVHLLSNSGSGLPNEVWFPATIKLKPETANQISIGINIKYLKGFEITSEAYYKTMQHVIDYAEGSDFMATISNNWEENIIPGGKGKSYGLELGINHTAGKIVYNLSYTLSWNYRKFNEINLGEWYPFRYDRRHVLAINSAFKLRAKWNLYTNWTLMSGQAVTLPVAWIEDINGNLMPVYSKRNNERLPVYHRLDLAFQKEFKTRKGKDANFRIGVYNAYARRNPIALEIFQFPTGYYDGSDFIQTGYSSQVEQYSLFGFLPYVSYSLKIN